MSGHRTPDDLHPATRQLIRHFEYTHLPVYLRTTSRKFHDLAWSLVEDGLRGGELTVCLRKLLEAKDCAVRSALDTNAEKAAV